MNLLFFKHSKLLSYLTLSRVQQSTVCFQVDFHVNTAALKHMVEVDGYAGSGVLSSGLQTRCSPD